MGNFKFRINSISKGKIIRKLAIYNGTGFFVLYPLTLIEILIPFKQKDMETTIPAWKVTMMAWYKIM